MCLFALTANILLILLQDCFTFKILIRSVAFICLQNSLKISFQKWVILNIFLITILRIDYFWNRRNRGLVWNRGRKNTWRTHSKTFKLLCHFIQKHLCAFISLIYVYLLIIFRFISKNSTFNFIICKSNNLQNRFQGPKHWS